MDLMIKEKFMALWEKYFGPFELPLTFYYSSNPLESELVRPGTQSRCLVGALTPVRQGHSLAFGASSIGCPGGKRYTGFTQEIREDFEYLLSCGRPGKLEGERYKKHPNWSGR